MVAANYLTSTRSTVGNIWDQYRSSLKRQPLLTKSLTSLTGFAIGDVIAQMAQPGKHKYDVARTVRLAAFGGLVGGPMAHGWFQVLDKGILPSNPKHPVAVVSKMVLDQVLMAPVGTCIFYMSLATMSGVPMKGICDVREKLVPTLVTSYKLWPAAHLVNFAMVPPHMRVLYINVVSVVWAVMLSTIASKPSKVELT